MCGIATLIKTSNLQDSECLTDIQKMTEIIAHRGPNGSGYWSDDRVALGHRRLSIVDLSDAGRQPMHYLDRYIITYNGEVYNHAELREELVNLGYSFRSHTDTEVILAAYDKWGEDCLNRFNGMWGFVLYDTQDKSLFAARDRFGVKPFYYWVSPKGFIAIGSEIKQFTVLSGWNPQVNIQYALDFLAWGIHDHTDETFFSGVFQLAPGHSLFLQNGFASSINQRLKTKQWYQLPRTIYNGNWKDAVSEFKNRFTDAVRLRLRADVPVGSCLSGGLDSSSIVCIANQILTEQNKNDIQRTFSAYSEHKKFDESTHIGTVVDSLAVNHFSTTPSLTKLKDDLDKIVWHQDEPFGSTSIFAQWEVFKLARANNCIVMLDGQGSDEQLGGYSGFIGTRLAELIRTGHWIATYKEMKAHKKNQGFTYTHLIKMSINNLISGKMRILARILMKKNTPMASWLNFPKGCETTYPYERFKVPFGSINDLCYAQFTFLNLQMLLRYEDRDSMAHSIESRVPFVDYRLAEFVSSLPPEFKISDGLTKKILRYSMEGVLPKSIQWRMDKLGFATAEEVWMTKEDPDYFKKELQDAVHTSKGLITANILREFDEMLEGNRSFDTYIWRAISFSRWIKLFNVQVPCV